MKQAWELQKKLQQLQKIPSMEQMLEKIRKIKAPRDQALIATLYFTGGRRSEVLDIKPEDVNAEVITVKVGLDEKRTKECLVINMPNRKNRVNKWKTLAMPLKREQELCNIILKWAKSNKSQEKMFNIRDAWTYCLTKEYTGFNPHFIRHIRLTHLRRDYDLHPMLVMRWAGWSDLRPAKRYDEGVYKDFIVQL